MNALPRVAIRDVIDVVCEHFNVSMIDLRSARKSADIVLPRHWACYLAARLTEKSFPQIGKALSRDHTSVMAGRENISALIKADHTAAAVADDLEIAVLALARLRSPGSIFERKAEDEPLSPHEIAQRILKGGRRAAMHVSVEDIIGLCEAVIAAPEPLLITETQTAQEPVTNV